MKAGQVVFRDLLGGNIQYRVPLFQRTYSWGETNWQRLWDDLLEIYAMKEQRDHFIGGSLRCRCQTRLSTRRSSC